MDITSRNFVEKFPLIKKSVESADFIAFDFEFSGLNTCPEDMSHDYESDESKYQKLKNTVQKCNAFQIGLATFKWDPKDLCYVSRPFNVYLFPHSDNYFNVGDHQKILQFTPSCLRFNMRNNFNFNRLFRMGVNYHRLNTDKEIIRKLVEIKVDTMISNEKDSVRRSLIIPKYQRNLNSLSKSDQAIMDASISKIKVFMEQKGDDQVLEYREEIDSVLVRKNIAKELRELDIIPFKGEYTLEVGGYKSKVIYIKKTPKKVEEVKVDPQKKLAEQLKVHADEEMKVDEISSKETNFKALN